MVFIRVTRNTDSTLLYITIYMSHYSDIIWYWTYSSPVPIFITFYSTFFYLEKLKFFNYKYYFNNNPLLVPPKSSSNGLFQSFEQVRFCNMIVYFSQNTKKRFLILFNEIILKFCKENPEIPYIVFKNHTYFVQWSIFRSSEKILFMGVLKFKETTINPFFS